MTTIKSYTDIEQSRKLAEILPLESADMVYIASADDDNGEPLYTAEYKLEIIIQEDDEFIHCWSLAALMEILPKKFGRYTKSLYWYDDTWHCEYVDEDGASSIGVSSGNAVDACVEMIVNLKEIKL